MRALDLKLLRDFVRLWAQSLSIALVLGCGVAILLISFGMYGALETTREAYYERNRFADIFANARRAPRTLEDEILTIDGIWAVDLRIVRDAVLDLPDRIEASTGRIISLPPGNNPRLNVPLMRSGRLPDPGAVGEVVVNEPFAEENGFVIGDIIHANLNGAKRPLTITGTALSPEFIYSIGPGQLLPDNKTFGILWMPQEAVEAAFDMAGAFNDVGVKISREAEPEEVVDRLEDLLKPYGGTGAFDRMEQTSHAFIDSEMEQLRTMAYILPPVFFAIAAYLVNMVIGRIVALERGQIGLLKALGYNNLEVSMHYVYLAVLIAIVGVLIGWGIGTWLARGMAVLYANFFTFPYLLYHVPLTSYAISGLLGIGAAAGGAIINAIRAARLEPAIAMSPPAPPNFRRGFFDRMLTAMRLSQPTMMVLRGITRWPMRAILTSFGLSLAVAVLVASSFFEDSIEEVIDVAFFQANRQHAMLVMSGETRETALEEVKDLPAVLRAEGAYSMPARLVNGHLEKRVSIEARRPDDDLARIISADGDAVVAPTEGILLSGRLAGQLDVEAGDTLDVEFLFGRRESFRISVTGTVIQYFGLGAYVDADYAARLLRQEPQISFANLLVDHAGLGELHGEVKQTPNVAGLVMISDARDSFRETISQNILIMTTIYFTIAVLITAGVTYNSTRIQLSERARELASLRILGFTNLEVSYILMGEILILVLLAQPLGWAIGSLLVWSMVQSFSSDLYAIPIVLKRDTFAYASVVAIGAAIISALIVRRRLDTLNLVSVMKTRE
ncbi:ABC transporter permease [Oricola sp.]|uniref:ABC transporter permease n=1 Tax=Oricola sp. TaxID=1979950 RepID=UPI003BAD932B